MEEIEFTTPDEKNQICCETVKEYFDNRTL